MAGCLTRSAETSRAAPRLLPPSVKKSASGPAGRSPRMSVHWSASHFSVSESSAVSTLAASGQVLDRRHDVLQRSREIWLEVASPDDPLARIKVDQNQWPLAVHADLRDDRTIQRHHHGPHLDGLKGEGHG